CAGENLAVGRSRQRHLDEPEATGIGHAFGHARVDDLAMCGHEGRSQFDPPTMPPIGGREKPCGECLLALSRKRGQISGGRVVTAIGRSSTMPQYIPSPRDWVREQVELYESSGGTKGTTLRDTGLPVILVTHTGNKTGAVRKTPLMRVKDGDRYVLVGSQG